MLIIGAKGFAKEVLEILHQQDELKNIVFYDDVNNDIGDVLYNKFPILRTENEVLHYFKTTSNNFTIGFGNPILRFKMYEKFNNLNGTLTTLKSKYSNIGSYEVAIGKGTILMDNVIVSNSVTIGKGCIVYYNATITHDCIIDDFVEISPSVNLLGYVKIGKFTQIGANATVLPNITIGKNVIIGAGAVVTKDIPDNTMVYGSPAKVIK